MPGVILLLATIAVLNGATRWRGFSYGRIALCCCAVLAGGILCAIPGVVVSLLVLSGVASGASPMPAWPVTLSCGSALLGALAGLWVGDRAGSHARARPVAWIGASVGFLLGAGVAFFSLVLAQNGEYELTALILGPITIASATLAGYSLLASGRPRPRATGAG
jgi:hypothetical protein